MGLGQSGPNLGHVQGEDVVFFHVLDLDAAFDLASVASEDFVGVRTLTLALLDPRPWSRPKSRGTCPFYPDLGTSSPLVASNVERWTFGGRSSHQRYVLGHTSELGARPENVRVVVPDLNRVRPSIRENDLTRQHTPLPPPPCRTYPGFYVRLARACSLSSLPAKAPCAVDEPRSHGSRVLKFFLSAKG